MHNGQVGGFENFRRHADMCIPDELYEFRRGATDSEVLFLLTLSEDMDADPKTALEKAVARMEGLSRARGTTPHMRLSVAMSDGEKLYAARYSSDRIAPTVYYRWSKCMNGWAVVSEPLEQTEQAWSELKSGEFLTLTRDGAEVQPFHPQLD